MTSRTDPLPKLPTLPRGGAKTRKPPRLPKLPKKPEPVPDPLDKVEYTGDAEEDFKREFDALQEGYRERAEKEAARQAEATDGAYYFCVCLRTDSDREKLCQALGLHKDTHYADGYELARLLNVDL